jgi:predicted  nucleic acid-binding Zn-ribbon protein
MKKDRMEVLLEKMFDELRAVLEDVAGIRKVVNNQPTRDEFNELQQDVKTIKAALAETNRDVADLDRRVTRLEAA